jgi:hypothetical protein
MGGSPFATHPSPLRELSPRACHSQQGHTGQAIRPLSHVLDQVCEVLGHKLVHVVIVGVVHAMDVC